jgi:hypothetical protein
VPDYLMFPINVGLQLLIAERLLWRHCGDKMERSEACVEQSSVKFAAFVGGDVASSAATFVVRSTAAPIIVRRCFM